MNMQSSTSELTNNIYKQLSDAQADMKPISKDVSVVAGQTRYKHTSIENLFSSSFPVLKQNDLVFTSCTRLSEMPFQYDDMICLGFEHCKLVSLTTKEEITSDLPLLVRDGKETYPDGKVKKGANPMQMLGGAITYAKRYGLFGLLGLAPNVDTDAADTSVPIDVTPNPVKVAFQPKVSEVEQNKIGLISYELNELWKKKQGSVRADGSPEAMRAIQRFESDFAGMNYEQLVKLKDFINQGNFVDVIIPRRLPTNETNIIH